MSMILENLIRTYLIEGRTVGKIRSASAKDTAAARAAGAVYAYNVLVKGTSNELDIIELVTGASLASTGADTENRVAVGRSSKFGDGGYDYVMSDPLPKKRQIIVVRIFKSIDIVGAQTGREPSEGTSVEAASSIGASPLYTTSQYKDLLKFFKQDTTPVDDLKSKDSEASDAIKQTSDVIAGNKQVTDHELKRDGKVVGKFNGTLDKNERPLEGKAVLTDGQWFDGIFKDGDFVTGTCRKIIADGVFEGELTDGVPTANVTHHIIKPDGKYYEGTVNTNFLPVDGSVYTTSAKTEKQGDFILGAWNGVTFYPFTNQQIIDGTKSSKYSDASKYFQQLMVDKIATQPKIVAKLGDTYTKVKNNVDGKWGNDSKTLTIKMKQGLKLDPADGTVTDVLINKINGLDKETVISKNPNESIFHLKNTLSEQFDLDAVDNTTPKTVTPKPKTITPVPKPQPKPIPTPPQDTNTDKVYVLQKDYVINYVPGSADEFLRNMKKWLIGSHRLIGQVADDVAADAIKYKWFDRKTITIPKGTKVYIHPTYVVMIAKDGSYHGNTPDGTSWRIKFNYKDKTLSTSSFYGWWAELWKKYIKYDRWRKKADELDIDNLQHVAPKYYNAQLIGFLKTLNPAVQSKKKYVQTLSKQDKQELDKNFKSCVDMAKSLYAILEKNPTRYFGKFKDDDDLKGAQVYFQDVFKYVYESEFKRLNKGFNNDIRDNTKKIDMVYAGVQEYLSDLQLNKDVTSPVYRFTLIHPYDTKKNVKVTIRFNYLP